MSANNSSGASNCSDHHHQINQGPIICSSLVEISDGKGRPLGRRLTLTSTHLIVQKNVIVTKEVLADDVDSMRPTHGSISDRGLSADGSFDSFVETDSPPPESNKREVTLSRVEGVLGISVRGGAEHSLPLIVSRLSPGSPAALCKGIYIGDAIISINGVKITKMDHDSAVEFLSSSGPTVVLKLKYFSTAKPFLSPTQNNLVESNLEQWEVSDERGGAESSWEVERQIPLSFAFLTRYLGTSDRLRCNAFEVRDGTGNVTSGVIHCSDSYSLTSWIKCISDVISALNNIQMKSWSQESHAEIFYIGWVSEGTTDKSSDLNSPPPMLTWRPKILCFRGESIYYMDYPPGVGGDWDSARCIQPIITSLLRILSSSDEQLDERQNCFSLQIATENPGFPPSDSRPEPITLYLSTETRAELIKIETAWTKAVSAAVKATKKCMYHVWWGGKPCQLELDYVSGSFNLYRSSSKPSPPLWTRQFSALKGSSDDSRTRLTLKFHSGTNSNTISSETMECRDLHRVLFSIHSFLLTKVVH